MPSSGSTRPRRLRRSDRSTPRLTCQTPISLVCRTDVRDVVYVLEKLTGCGLSGSGRTASNTMHSSSKEPLLMGISTKGESPVARDWVVELVGLEPTTKVLWNMVRVRPTPLVGHPSRSPVETSPEVPIMWPAVRIGTPGRGHRNCESGHSIGSRPCQTVRCRVPAAYFERSFVTNGGLISYSSDEIDRSRGAASYVDRILRGEKPGDLPYQLPTKYRLVVNLKTARAMELQLPTQVFALADEVIE